MKQAPSEILDRMPPSNTEAEMCVLGSLLILPDVCDEVALIVRPEDFYSDANERIYRHMLALHEEGKRLDPLLLRNRLKQAGEFDDVGGDAYLADLARAVPTAANAESYANMVRQKARLRRITVVATRALRDVYSESADPRLIAAGAEQAFGQIVTNQRAEGVSSDEAVTRAQGHIREVYERQHGLGVPTGLFPFDQQIGGLHPGELIILAARPGMGKTAMAVQITRHNAEQSRGVLFISLEMAADELMTRAMCAIAGVDAGRIRNGRLEKVDLELLELAGERMRKATLNIVEDSSVTVADIRAIAKSYQRRQPLSLVVVDYLQLVPTDDETLPRHQQVGRITKGLRRMAKELGVPVLALAQLSREVDKGGDHLPRLGHLRESGDIESDADVVLFLHRAEVYNSKDPDLRGRAELLVKKNRKGPTNCEFNLRWDAATTTFVPEGDLTSVDWERAHAANDEWGGR